MNRLESILTERGLAEVRASAAGMRAVYAAVGIVEEPDPDPVATEEAIVESLTRFGPQYARELRMGGPGGVAATSDAIERLAAAGRIVCRMCGRWRLV